MKKLLFLISFLFGANLFALIPPDSCLRLVYPVDSVSEYDHYKNPDSVMIDICSDSIPYHNFYARKKFKILLYDSSYIFRTVPLQKNSFVGIEEIDSNNFYSCYQGFKALYQKYGLFYFIRDTQELADERQTDSMHLLFPEFCIYFQNIVNIDSAKNDLQNIDKIRHASYRRGYIILVSVNNEYFIDTFFIFPNPVTDILHISGDYSGEQVSIYSPEGFKVYEAEFMNEIDLSKLPVGIYFMRVRDKIAKFSKF
jgi:hypothetical protein